MGRSLVGSMAAEEADSDPVRLGSFMLNVTVCRLLGLPGLSKILLISGPGSRI